MKSTTADANFGQKQQTELKPTDLEL